jgi:predicted enzyme related to lactoylglutathione lyase
MDMNGRASRQAAQSFKEVPMRLKFISLMVEDQAAALRFYTSVLGFQKKTDISMGEYRWLTVTAPDGPADMEGVLEPMGFAPARVYQKALFEAGMPATIFITRDIAADVKRLTALGVKFRGEPMSTGPNIYVTFEDTCGNLIQLLQPAGNP